jgi:Tol biopolymer transport system component
MKHPKWIVTGIGAALMALVAGSFLAQQAKTPSIKDEVALRTAIEKETVQGDLKGAIEQYKKLSQSSDHAVAAQALIHMGECYEKLGSNEARKQYDLVISKFPDQKDAVAQARAHLGATHPKPFGMAERPVWELPRDFGRAVSPDGRYIAFADDSGNLALHDLTTSTDRRLTHEDQGIDEVAFAPDGKQIAYIEFTLHGSIHRSELRVLDLSGTGQTAPRVFTHDDWEFDTVSWSRDGKWLASSAGPSGKPSQIVLVSVQDGSVRELKAPQPNSDHLDFSPDGKYLAYTRTKNLQSGDIYVLPINGGNEIPVVDSPSNEYAMGWSPDGHLLFSSDRGGSKGLWALPFKDGKPQGSPAQITASIGDGVPVGLTSSGDLYYQVTSGGTIAYYQIAPFDWNTGRILAPTVTVGPVVTTSPADWSRDGKYFAYIKPVVGVGRPPGVTIRTTETGASRELGSDCLLRPLTVHWAPDGRTLAALGTGGLCLIDGQTGQASKIETALGPGEFFVGGAQWSPDQKKLYFRRLSIRPGGGDSSMAFIEKDLASGDQREIIRRPGAADLGGQISPDGRSLGVVSQDVSTKSASLLLIPLAGGEPKELLRLPGEDLWNLAFSPDGKYIRTAGFARNNWTPVWFIPTAGGEPQAWLSSTPPLVVTGGFWAPDSKSIFLRKTTKAGEQTELWRVPVGGGQAVKMDINMNLDHNGTGPYVSPDGSQIAILREETTPRKNEIWVLENFLSSIPASK